MFTVSFPNRVEMHAVLEPVADRYEGHWEIRDVKRFSILPRAYALRAPGPLAVVFEIEFELNHMPKFVYIVVEKADDLLEIVQQ
jgi:hypothetical protein